MSSQIANLGLTASRFANPLSPRRQHRNEAREGPSSTSGEIATGLLIFASAFVVLFWLHVQFGGPLGFAE
ncbi:MAG TPA: hypothetical protein VMN79_03895 [Casimicrobiaceae bacterium]|nr:hypothetical protein [Casimicrobiaceae bacterium]